MRGKDTYDIVRKNVESFLYNYQKELKKYQRKRFCI